MPFGAIASIAAPIAGSVVSGLMGSSTPGGSGATGGSNLYVPQNLGFSDQSWADLMKSTLGNYNNIAPQLIPYGQQSLLQGMGNYNYYGPQAQNAANLSGQQYSNLGTQLGNAANANYGTANSLLGAGQSIYNMGLDPQMALYNQQIGNVQDQANAVNSMYGLGSSAAGAGLLNNALSNFDINWQNNQLNRALQGAQGYGQLANTAGQFQELAGNQAAQGAGYTGQGGMVPYNTSQQLASAPGQLANTYGQFLGSNIYSPSLSFMGALQNYMNPAIGANQNAYNASNQAAGALGSSISQGISGLGNYFGGGGGGNTNTAGLFGTGSGTNYFSSSPYYSGGGNSYGFTL